MTPRAISRTWVRGRRRSTFLSIERLEVRCLLSGSPGGSIPSISPQPEWILTGQVDATDPLQGVNVPFGTANIGPQTGNVQLAEPLDFFQSIPMPGGNSNS